MKKTLLAVVAMALSFSIYAQLRLSTVSGSSSLGYNGGGGVAEITAFDKFTKQLYVINGVTNSIVVYDFSNPQITPLTTVTVISIPNSGSINSIACKNGLLALVYEDATNRQLSGYLQLITTTGNMLVGGPVNVGAQPDMVTFTPDGNKILVANEGEPSVDYTTDPEGSVSIVDVLNPTSPVVQTVTLSSLNGTIPHLSSQPSTMPGVRIFGMKNSLNFNDPNYAISNVKTPSTVAEDLEPEYITISPDGKTAWVSCQENNALLVIDIPSASLTKIIGLGYKNHNIIGNGFDASRTPTNTNSVNIRPWAFKGMYQPDGISVVSINGIPYVFSANEGDARHWPDGGTDDGKGLNEELDVNASVGARFNTANFTQSQISEITATGIRLTNTMGNLNGGNPFLASSVLGNAINATNNFEELYTFGTRSFSVWNGLTGEQVWDSGDQLERITYTQFPLNFNADHNGGSANNVRRRSNTKGPEPESIITEAIGDSIYAFIALERIGGVMVYNVTDPTRPYFRQYINPRNFSVVPGSGTANTVGDLGPEGLLIIKASESADGNAYLITSNEVSGTIRAFLLDYKQNVAQNVLKPFIIEANQSESQLQVLNLKGSNFTSPLTLSTSPFFGFSLSSTTGFSNFTSFTFTGNNFDLNVYVKYTGAAAYGKSNISIYDANNKNATQVELVGIKTTTTVGAPAYTLQILHGSDFEAGLAALENAPKFVAIWNKFNSDYPNTLRLSGGDNYIPSPFFNAAADAALRPTFSNINRAFYGTVVGTNLREGIGRADINILNMLDLHASAVGNHEFDAGTGTYLEIINVAYDNATNPTQVRWLGTRFPYLSANLDFSSDINLSGLYTSEIRPVDSYRLNPLTTSVLSLTSEQRKKIAPAAIVTIGGQAIGLVGGTTQIVEKISSTGGVKVMGTNVDDMPLLASQLQPVIDNLRNRGINKIVVMTHLQQLTFEKQLAPLLSGVDIVLAAGSHTLLADADDDLEGATKKDDYPLIATGKDGGKTLIICTENEYQYVGRLVIDFDANGNVIPSSYVTSICGAWKATDAGMAKAGVDIAMAFSGTNPAYLTKGLIDGINIPNGITIAGVSATCPGIRTIINSQDGNIFGKTNVFIEGRREQVRLQETNLGNLSADANLAEARKLYPDVMISIKNGGGIRAAIGVVSAVGGNFVLTPPLANPNAGKSFGDISQLDILNSLRFNNSLSVGQISASSMLAVLNHAVAASGPGATPGQFAQIGGIRYSWNPNLAAGTRVRSAAVVDDNGNVIDVIAENGVVVGDPSRLFRMVTLNFMVGNGGAGTVGGDNYPLNTATFLNRIDLGSGVTINGYNTVTGAAAFGAVGGEQDAFAKYMKSNYSTTGYNVQDTPEAQDLRIQNLNVRAEAILPNFSMPIATLTGVLESRATIYSVSISGSKLAQPITIQAPMGAMVNGLPMITVAGNGGSINVSAIPQTLGASTFTITLTSASLVKTFTHTLIGTPRTTTLTGVWTLTGDYLASVPSLKIADFTQGTVTGTIFEGGFSGLHYIKGTNGLEFYTLGDRGPNVDADAANGNAVTKLFPVPTYAPKYHKIKLMPDQTISITSTITFKRPDGSNVSGLVPPTTLGGTGEVAWDINQNVLAGDDWGIDCEGIVEGKANDVWVCDEYGVNIWRFNKNDGSLINRYSPFGTVVGGNLPLPADLSKKRANRGFEGVAVTPNGMVYALIQSPMLNPTSAVQSTSRIHRLVQLDPKTGEVKTFVYVNDGTKANTRIQDWKLGDLVAVNNNEFLVIEHTDRTPYNKYIYKINISTATALTSTSGFVNGTATGVTLEQLTNAAGLSANNIVPVSKMLVADLQDYGYDQNLGMDKPEGLTIVDANTIVVTNDNDFQVSAPALDGKIVMTNKLCFVHQFKLETPLNYVPVFNTPSISFVGANITVNGPNLDLSSLLTSNSNGAKSFSILAGNAASISGSSLVAITAGTVTVTGTVESSLGFDAGAAMAEFTISPAPQVLPNITFNGFNVTVGGGNIDLSTLFFSNSDGVKSFSVVAGDAATLSGNNLVPLKAGVVTVSGFVTSTSGFLASSASTQFTIVTVVTQTKEFSSSSFTLFPNPVTNGEIYLSKTLSGSIFNATGYEVITFTNSSKIDVSSLAKGIYLIKTKGNAIAKFIIE